MDINSFQTLDREAQLAEAGKIAGVEPSVFDGMWRTESGRGASMLSPAGAEGHFGLMPKTRKTMEGRFGAPIDPYKFSDSLFTAAHLMKENLGRFGNLPDALRAYNGGWEPKAWNNPETLAYAGKVLGTDEEEGGRILNASTAEALGSGAATRALSPAASLWDRPAAGPQAHRNPPADLSPVMAAVRAATITPQAPAEPDYSGFNALVKAGSDAAVTKTKLADDTGFLDTMRAAAHSSLLQQTLISLFKEDYKADPSFTVKEEALKGRDVYEQRELRAARSQAEFNRILFDQDYDKEQSDITNRNGALYGFGASLLADLPAAAFTGGLASLGADAAGIGAMQLAAQGRKAAALGASAIEGIAGNVAYTAGLDALGKHQGAEGYAMAVAGGLLNPLLGAKAIGRETDRAAAAEHAIRIAETAKKQQELLLVQAKKNLGEAASGDDLAKEMSRLEAEGLRAEVASHTATVPESRKFNVGEESPEAIPEAAVSEKSIDSPDTANKVIGRDAAEPWQAREYHQARMNAAAENPEWRDSIKARSEGMEWEEVKALPKGVNTSENFKAASKVNPAFAKAEGVVQSIVREYLPEARILLTTASKAGENGGIVSVGNTHIISLNLMRAEKGQIALDHTTLHELGHAIFHQKAPFVAPEVMSGINRDWLAFVNAARKEEPGAFTHRYAATADNRYTKTKGKDPKSEYDVSRDEYMAEQFVHHIHGRLLRGEYGQMEQTVVSQIMDGIKAVFQYAKDLWKGRWEGAADPARLFKGKDEGPDRFFSAVLNSVEQGKIKAGEAGFPTPKVAAMDKAGTADVEAIAKDPIALKYGLDMLPMGTTGERAEAKQILNVYRRADAWAAANPLDEKRLNRILSRFDSFDPISNQMLRSQNPVVRMVASELLENGGGAAGRRSSAAISKYMNERAIIGNVINDMEGSFNLWLKGQGSDKTGEFFTGRKRTEFNKLVAEEIEQRRYPGTQSDFGDHVRAAADAVEQSFERARLMQQDAKTIGWASLPETSKGYMPHRMSPDKVRSLTNAQRRALHGALTDQFIEGSGFDMSFADQLASKYLERIESRALGGFDAPAGLHQTGAHEVVKEALEAMGMNRAEVDATLGKYMAGGAGHTKKRLNLDLRQKFTNDDGTSFRLLDLFDTDMLSLVRGQSQRVSGEVALARHGIMGKPGLAILRRGMMKGEAGVSKATDKELEAFDAAAAEFLGSPFGTQNKWVDRAMQANSVASLGGMGFNQLGEIINVGTTLGVGKAFSAIASIARMRAEIKLLAKGKAVENPWLQSIEKMGGAEFGTDAYKMVFPMDLPDAPIHTMGADTLSATDRLLRGAGHLQSKLSMWRTIHSTQMRGVAEQIVRTFADALHKGKTDVTLADMGLTADVLERLRADKDNILIVRDGKLDGFDITKATDKDAAMQLVQAVHRGAGQMIQGTFIGEQGKYVHNSYLKMLAQFRGFSLTAIDKQWNRQKGNKGVAAALGMTVGAMGAAAPIYMVRTYLASIGRADQDAYLERQLSFGAIARATTNYIATSGLAGDFLDVLTAVTGHGEMTGGRSGTNTSLVGNLAAPALGKVDKLWGAVQDTKDGTDVHGLVQQLPFARLPVFIPAINALGH